MATIQSLASPIVIHITRRSRRSVIHLPISSVIKANYFYLMQCLFEWMDRYHAQTKLESIDILDLAAGSGEVTEVQSSFNTNEQYKLTSIDSL